MINVMIIIFNMSQQLINILNQITIYHILYINMIKYPIYHYMNMNLFMLKIIIILFQ
jgi:hypothetical protein